MTNNSKPEIVQLVCSFTTANPKGGRRVTHKLVLVTGTRAQVCKGASHWKTLGVEWARSVADPSMSPSPLRFRMVHAW